MSIASEITRLQTAKANIKTSIENKGVVVSSSDKLDDYSSLIDSINISTQVKTVNPQNYTREITPDVGYRGLSKVVLDGVLVDAHDSYTSTTDDDVAYEKIVPSGALNYASLDKLGGMSYKCNNLFNENGSYENGVFDPSGNIVSNPYWKVYTDYIELLQNQICCSYVFTTRGQINLAQYDSSKTFISTLTYDVNSYTPFIPTLDANCKYIRVSYRFDLMSNLMINYGTTPLPYEAVYFTGIRDSAITSVVSKDSNNTTLETKTIDSHITALTGYGWGINDTCYNYIDYATKKFVQKVARVDLGSLSWNLASANRFNSTNISTLVKRPTSDSTQANILCAIFTSWYKTSIESVPNRIAIDTGGAIWTSTDGSYANANAFKTAMSGVYLYYELATPVETDISQYIDNNFIEVEAGGTNTFNNIYNQAVPSEITYLKEVQQ